MPVEFELPAACSQRGAQDGLAFEDVGRVLFQRDVIEVEMRVGVVAEVGAGIQPEVEDLTQIPGGQASAAFVDETDNGNLLLAEGAEQLFRPRPAGRSSSVPSWHLPGSRNR